VSIPSARTPIPAPSQSPALPHWEKTDIRILTAPAMGASFVQYLLDIQTGGGTVQAVDLFTR